MNQNQASTHSPHSDGPDERARKWTSGRTALGTRPAQVLLDTLVDLEAIDAGALGTRGKTAEPVF